MRHRKYPQIRKADPRIDYNKPWVVYWSAISPNPMLYFTQGSTQNKLTIEYSDDKFEVCINGESEMKFKRISTIRDISDVTALVNNISDKLIMEGIIRGRLGGESFDDPDTISDVDFITFAQELIDRCRCA